MQQQNVKYHNKQYRKPCNPKGERKGFGLRVARIPHDHEYLSSAVILVEGHQRGFRYINFKPNFVTHCAKIMPRGLSAMDKGYLKIVRSAKDSKFYVWCCYIDGPEDDNRLLWVSDERPEWLHKNVLRLNNIE